VENCGKPVETPVGSQEKFEKNIKTKDIFQSSPLFFSTVTLNRLICRRNLVWATLFRAGGMPPFVQGLLTIENGPSPLPDCRSWHLNRSWGGINADPATDGQRPQGVYMANPGS